MGINISRLNVMLTGNVDGFEAAMKTANHVTREFGDGLKEHIAHVAEFAEAMALVEVAKHAAESIIEHTKATFENIDAEAKLADSLGVSTQALGGLKYAASYAGASVEDVSNGLLHMEKNLEAARAGTESAAHAFELLHLDAKELQAESPDEAFKKIADGLKEMDNASQRNAVAFEIFGKGVKPLLPLLAGGSEEIEKFSAEAKALGYSFDRVDAAKVEAANDAIQKTANIAQGALNQLAIATAPYIEALANKLNDVATSGGGIASKVVPSLEAIAQAVAYGGDGVNLLIAGWHGVEFAILEATSNGVEKMAILASALDQLLVKLHQTPTGLGETLTAMTASLRNDSADQAKATADAWDKAVSGDSHKKIEGIFDAIKKGSQESAEAMAKLRHGMGGLPEDLNTDTKKVQKILDDLKKQVDDFGKTDSQKKADELKGLGATDAQLEQADALAKQADALKDAQKVQKEMASDAAKLWEQTRTPLEKYNEEIDKANELLAAGLIDSDTFQREGAKALDTLEKSQKSDKSAEHEIPKLLAAGSQEAASFIAKIQAREHGNDTQQQLVVGQKDGNTLLKNIYDVLSLPATADAGVSF